MDVKVEPHDDVYLVTLSGELTTGETNDRFREELEKLRGAGSRKVVLDLSLVSYLDSSALGLLVHGHSALTKGGGGLKLELLSKVVDGASGGDLILPDSVDEFHIFNDLSQAAVAL